MDAMDGIGIANRMRAYAAVAAVPLAVTVVGSRPAAAQSMDGNSPCGASADAPCPNLLEIPCGNGNDAGPGGHGGGLARICDCACGGGWWGRSTEKALLFPMRPVWGTTQTQNFNLTSWTWSVSAFAGTGSVEVSVDVSGTSTFWHAGSLTRSSTARQQTTEREDWVGVGIPCPRMVNLAAMGGAVLELSLTCSPDIGCAASGSVSIAGACNSLGNATAQLTDKTVHGSVGYSTYEHSIAVEGKFGLAVDDDSVGIDGKISRKVNWHLAGDGCVSGSAAYVATPDRTYCAFTNRPLVIRSNGQAVATGGATVADNGSASMSGMAIVSLAVH
jgi:hypothetical protein